MLFQLVLLGQDIAFDISKKEISLDENFFITVRVKNKSLDKPIIFPEIAGTTRDQLFTRPLMSGKVYIQTYLPDKVGQISIPSFEILAGGKSYKSPNYSLNIKKGLSDKEEKEYTATNFDPKLVIETFPKTPYIGQQMRSQVVLYVPYDQEGNYELPTPAINELQKQAQIEGFWTEEVKLNDFSYKDTIIEGRKYIKHLLYQAYVFPLDTGAIKWENLYLRVKRKYVSDDAPNAKDMQSARIALKWDTVYAATHQIAAVPLPPTSLLNAHSVGDWTMATEISDRESFTGEVITLKVTIQGIGNVALIPKPIITVPKQLIGEEPLTTTIIQKDSMGVSGTKYFIFEWMPTQAGHYELGPIVLYYFNSSTQQYDSLRSEMYRLHITGEDKSMQLAGTDREEFYENVIKEASDKHYYTLPYAKYWAVFLFLFTLFNLAYLLKKK